MSPQEMIDVIQAYKDGKQIIFSFKTNDSLFKNDWINIKTPIWNFEQYNYKVISKTPKTMYQYLLYSTKDNRYICTSTLYSSMEDAIEDYKSSYWTVVKRLDYTEITITE